MHQIINSKSVRFKLKMNYSKEVKYLTINKYVGNSVKRVHKRGLHF